jgi:hypothetical protein
MKPVRLITVCLNETYSKVNYVTHSQWSEIRSYFKVFAFQVCFSIRSWKVQENHVGGKLNEAHQLLFYADDVHVHLLGNNMHTMKKHVEALTLVRSFA